MGSLLNPIPDLNLIATVTIGFLIRNRNPDPDSSLRSFSGDHQVVTNDVICGDGVIICVRGTYLGSWFHLEREQWSCHRGSNQKACYRRTNVLHL